MKQRLFGRHTGMRVSELALGTGLFGTHQGVGGKSLTGIGEEAAREIFKAFDAAGGTFIDTAEGYQGGHSEEIVGRLVTGRRDDFTIATKYSVGTNRTEGPLRLGNSRKAVHRAIEGSLRRLNTDYVDLYWIHAPDQVTPTEEIVQILDELVKSGKVLYGGLGSMPAWRAARAVELAKRHHLAPITAINAEYGLGERSAERELLPMAEALGLGFGAWSPLASGFLTSGDDPQATSRLFHWTRNARPNTSDFAIRDAINAVATELGATPAQVGLAWTLEKARESSTGLVPITGADSAEQLESNLRALELTLEPGQIERLEHASGFMPGEPHVHNTDSEFLMGLDNLIRPAEPVA